MTITFYVISILLTLFAAICAEIPSTYKDYDGYQLLQIFPKTAEQLKLVSSLEKKLEEHFDFWKESGPLPENDANVSMTPTELFLSKEQKERVVEYLEKNDIQSSVRIEDVGQIIRDDAIVSLRPEGVESDEGPNFNLNEYHSHKEILNHLSFIAKANEEFVKLDSIGQSFEGRELAFLKIGYPSNRTKNVFFIDAGIHAREWITPAVALHFIDRLVNDKTLHPLLEDIDIYILPSLNPDGYEYSRNVDRLWRKSRTGPHGSRNCYGVDINRNFPFYWSFSGVSHNPCSEVYCGPKELSENESSALTKYLQENNRTIKAYITLHSYGNLLIHPWGHIRHSYPDDIKEVYQAGLDVANAIQEAGGPEFTVGAGPQILYEVAGSSQDFAKSIGVKYTYTMELTNSPNGFIVSKREIQPVADQIIPGLLVFADRVKHTSTIN